MRIAFLVRALMVQAMSCRPHQRRALSRSDGAEQDEELGRPRQLERLVRQVAVIAEADADAGREPVGDQRDGTAFQVKKNGSRQAAGVNADHPHQRRPVDVLPSELTWVEPVVNFLRRDCPLDARRL